jgi:hypothetical protein
MADAPVVYHYSAVNGAYVGASAADPSPLEPDVWLYPAYSTPIAPPPAGANEAAVFANGAWSLAPDFIGQTFYAANGAPVVVTALGDPTALGLTASPPAAPPPPPPPSVPMLARALVAAASQACASIVAQVYPDPAHQAAFQNAASIINGNGGAAPTAGPLAAAFAALASAYDATPDAFAGFVLAAQAASLTLGAALATLSSAAAAASAAADLTAALAAFETAIGGVVSELDAALPSSITAPAAIAIAGLT